MTTVSLPTLASAVTANFTTYGGNPFYSTGYKTSSTAYAYTENCSSKIDQVEADVVRWDYPATTLSRDTGKTWARAQHSSLNPNWSVTARSGARDANNGVIKHIIYNR